MPSLPKATSTPRSRLNDNRAEGHGNFIESSAERRKGCEMALTVKKCAACGKSNPANATTCKHCGGELSRPLPPPVERCSTCGIEIPASQTPRLMGEAIVCENCYNAARSPVAPAMFEPAPAPQLPALPPAGKRGQESLFSQTSKRCVFHPAVITR